MLDYHASTNVAKCVIYQPDGLWAAVVAERLSFDREHISDVGTRSGGPQIASSRLATLTKRRTCVGSLEPARYSGGSCWPRC